MPRRLPAIAPHGQNSPAPDSAALAATAPAVVPATVDAGDPLERVRALARQPARYLAEPNPFTMALWATLQESAGTVLTRHAATMRAALEAQMLPPSSGEPGERPTLLASVPASLTVFQAVTDAVAVRAMQGDQRAADMIAARVEGSVGARRGDVDPMEAEQRARVRSTIEQIVRDMSDRAIQRSDTVLDVTPSPDDE